MTDRAQADKRVIACNYRVATKDAAPGALCYVLDPNRGNGGERVRVLVRSRGGRWIDRWEDSRRLKNFRLKTVPPEHGRYGDVWDRYGDDQDGAGRDAEADLAMLRRGAERERSRL